MESEQNNGTSEKRKRGRPRVSPEDKKMHRGVRITLEDWATYQIIGGNEWLREKLRAAKLTHAQQRAREQLLAELKGQQGLPLDAPSSTES